MSRTVLEYLIERSMKMGERICPDCGAHLDPEEKCDCKNDDKEK